MQFPAYAGMVANRSKSDIALFVQTMVANGLDPVAVGAIIESESGGSWSTSKRGPAGAFSTPPGYPVGLIQFAPSTAKSLGTSTAELESMSFDSQLAYVVKYYLNAGGPSRLTRPVDYYLAGWGDGIGTSDSYVLAKNGDIKYKWNQALDRNGDGQITTGDLNSLTQTLIQRGWNNGSLDVDETAPDYSSSIGGQSASSVAPLLVGLAALALAGGIFALVVLPKRRYA